MEVQFRIRAPDVAGQHIYPRHQNDPWVRVQYGHVNIQIYTGNSQQSNDANYCGQASGSESPSDSSPGWSFHGLASSPYQNPEPLVDNIAVRAKALVISSSDGLDEML